MRTLADRSSQNSLHTDPRWHSCVAQLNIHSHWDSDTGAMAPKVRSVSIRSSTPYLLFKSPGGVLICLQPALKRRPRINCTWPKWPLTPLLWKCWDNLGVIPVPGWVIWYVIYVTYYFSQVWKMVDSETSGTRAPRKELAERYSTVL